jgi:hypothetical protein
MIRKDDEGGGTGDLLLRAVVFEDDELEPLVGEVSGAREDSEGLAARLLAGLARGGEPGRKNQ